MLVVNDIESRPIFDALAYLELPNNQVMRELPLQTLPVESPSWGCSRADPTFGLADEVDNTLIPDPLRSGPPGDFVPILLDPEDCDGSGAQGPPSVPCTVGAGRDVFGGSLTDQQWYLPRIPMTCDAVAESEASWAARRAGTIPQLFADDIEIISVPGPSGTLVQVSCALTLLLLSQRGRGRR